ncbi:MAG: glycoside hydrolase family 15 protein [Steroidobacteraceae bacterium]|nr:glycoside hydrolase family 15 protein [Steroidobacteraceae bacterium]
MPSRIEDYALIGDGHSAALVSRDGSVDWLCWPRFDSGACFAALLGTPEHGRWLITTREPPRAVSRRYMPNTLILETTLETPGGTVQLVDFMPRHQDGSSLIRIVRCTEGRVALRTELIIRFDYGSIIPWVTQTRGTVNELRAVAGPDMLTLRTTVRLRGHDSRTVGEFVLEAGTEVSFVLTYGSSHLPPVKAPDVQRALSETRAFWQTWAGTCQLEGPWRSAVVRSLITLKALIYQPTGGIVAAPTTSLPERIHGERNWDYRFCWLRDATFTLLSLMDAGYLEEAERWRMWLIRALAGAPGQAQIMYGVGGERRLTELELSWLPGYEGSSPVRIGNAAAAQLQLDVYGEVADALQHARLGGLCLRTEGWAVQRALTEHVETIWNQPDEGIWEVRGPRQHFTHSKVMAWVALDRAIKAVEKHNLAGPVERWRNVRERIHAEVCAQGFNSKLGSFVQAYGSNQLDASLLMIPLVGFLPPGDPRVRGTVEAVGKHLIVDGLVHRYNTTQTDDGLPPGEGAFLACTFWYVDNLALCGRWPEARELFEHLLTLRNDVGLLAEQYDPAARRQLGNFPQAFSHVSLVDSAYNLTVNAPAKPAHQRSASRHS